MAFFTGRSEDGSDMIQTGFYISPDGNHFSNRPYTKEQKKHEKMVEIHWKVYDYLKKYDKTLEDEYNLIKIGKSTLSKVRQNYVKTRFEEYYGN